MRRLYVLIDNTLDSVYGCIQGGHAVAQWLIEHQNQKWNNSYLIYLSTDIDKWKDILTENNIDFSIFAEPDLDNKYTAIALESDGKIFRKLKLIK